MDSTTMIAVSSVMTSDNSIMYGKFVYEWWMGPTLFTILSLGWSRFWPFRGDDFGDLIFGRVSLIIICLFLSMISWIIGGVFK